MNKEILDKMLAENFSDGYYHFAEDVINYPNSWCYVIWSLRGPGKTYSFLRYVTAREKKFIYMKRTNKDIDLLCKKGFKTLTDSMSDFDPSPFKPINRDFGTNIHPYKIDEGIAGFYEFNAEGEPVGDVLGYCISLNRIYDLKSFDVSEADYICFDECIPGKGQRVRKSEGIMLLNFYLTTARDRIKRGRGELILVLMANAEDIACPVINELEIMDYIADMSKKSIDTIYVEDKGIYLRHINCKEIDNGFESTGIYKAMKDTAFGEVAFSGDFAYNDFSSVSKNALKRYKPLIHLIYRRKHIYIYFNPENGNYHFCSSKNKTIYNYNIDTENDQKLFYLTHGLNIRMACIEGKVSFEKYSYYDLLINYKKYFDL